MSDQSMPNKTNNYCAAIAWLRTLRPGWNSLGGVPISEAAIHTAEVISSHDPAIVPRSNGGVQLEWHTDGLDLEVVIAPDGRLEADVGGRASGGGDRGAEGRGG